MIERENTELRKTLTAAKDELSDATHHLESLSRENISLATTLHAKDGEIYVSIKNKDQNELFYFSNKRRL